MLLPFALEPRMIGVIRRTPMPLLQPLLDGIIEQGVSRVLSELAETVPADRPDLRELEHDPEVREAVRHTFVTITDKLVERIKA